MQAVIRTGSKALSGLLELTFRHARRVSNAAMLCHMTNLCSVSCAAPVCALKSLQGNLSLPNIHSYDSWQLLLPVSCFCRWQGPPATHSASLLCPRGAPSPCPHSSAQPVLTNPQPPVTTRCWVWSALLLLKSSRKPFARWASVCLKGGGCT